MPHDEYTCEGRSARPVLARELIRVISGEGDCARFIAAEAGLAEPLSDIKMLIHVSTSEYAERTVDAVLLTPEYPSQLAQLNQQAQQRSRPAQVCWSGSPRFQCNK